MKCVVDEGVPRDLVLLLREEGCDVSQFPKFWKGTKNGRLLRLVKEAGFSCLLTSDKNIADQQNLKSVKLAVVVLPYQKLEDLKAYVRQISDALVDIEVGDIRRLSFSS